MINCQMSVYLVDTSIYGLEAGAKARDYTYRLMTEMHACVRVRHYSAPDRERGVL